MDKNWFQFAMLPLLFFSPIATAQEILASGDTQDAVTIQNTPAYTREQLGQMLAPIALYPDALIAQILMASTYPLEVVEAARWLQDPQYSSLRNDSLTAALEQQSWDPSVKSLVPFPQIIQNMNTNLQWTEQLGDAFLANQPAVMNTVQQLRLQAKAAGTLHSTPQELVTTQDQIVEIQPASAQVVYVPYYNPAVVYGTWAYPSYPPVYFAPPYGYSYNGDSIGFGSGFGVIAPFWGWGHSNWRNHRIDIDDNRFTRINHDHANVGGDHWQHNPAHRLGVPYNSAITRTQFQHASQESHRNYRGYNSNMVAGNSMLNTTNQQHPPMPAAHTFVNGANQNVLSHPLNVTPEVNRMRPAPEANTPSVTYLQSGERHQPMPVMPAHAHTPVPLYESLEHGSEARTNATRGAASRNTHGPAPAAVPAPIPAPAPPSAPKLSGGAELHGDEHSDGHSAGDRHR